MRDSGRLYALWALGFLGCFASLGPASAADGAAVAEIPRPPATWIAVTAPAFREAIEPLAEHRRKEGYRVLVLKTEDVLLPEQIRDGDGRPLKEHLSKLYREAGGPCSILLVGAIEASTLDETFQTVIPPLRGTIGRMKGEPTDNGYGNPTESRLPRVAVGRFPARSVVEATAMVRKTLDFERARAPALWADRITLLIGHPGGETPMERRLGEWFVQNAGTRRFEKISPRWTVRAIFHAPQSPYYVPDRHLREVSLRYLEEGQVFSVYLGHSNAWGLWSGDARFLTRDDWANLKIPSGSGVFITCGCYACQLRGPGGEGFGLAAIRNPDGPAAVIGAHGESYGAIGQLAVDGILPLLAAPDPPTRLGDWWLALAGGIARAGMDPLTFFLYDQADGSRGAVPLAVQRKEHLEMWMLLGDPAMRLPLMPMDIALECDGSAGPGKSIKVRGSRPGIPPGTRVAVTLERPFGSPISEPSPSPEKPGEAGEQAMLGRHERSNSTVIERREVTMADGRFECSFTLPDPLPWSRLTIRARAEAEGGATAGFLSLQVSP